MIKKSLILILLFCLAYPGYSQVIINEAHIAPLGSKLYRDLDGNPDSSIGIGSAGDSVSWDMSALMTTLHDSLYLADPRNTPYDNIFPSSGFCFIEPLLINFLTKSTTGIAQDGRVMDFFGSGQLVPIKFSPSVDLIEFPAAYQDSFYSSGTGSIVIANNAGIPTFDSLRIVMTLTNDSHMDGQGTLITPFDTFPALRQHIVETVDISIEGGIDLIVWTQWVPFISNSTPTNMYYWWTNDSTAGYHILSMGEDSGSIGDVRWMPSPAVQEVNNPPFAIADIVFGDEDVVQVIDVLANDYDIDGDPLSVSILNIPTNGTATVLGDNTIEYTPNQDFNGTDNIAYEICDTGANQLCSSTTILINIAAINDVPVAVNDSGYGTNPGGVIMIDVQNNDSDVEGDSMWTTLKTIPGAGSAEVIDGDQIQYTAAATFTGDVSFDYELCDDSASCDDATVFVKVSALGIESVTIINDVQVYPNPSSHALVIKLKNSQEAMFELYSLEGKQLLKTALIGKETSLDISELRPGNYLYKVSGLRHQRTEGGSITIIK